MPLDKKLKRPYSLEVYNPEWPLKFEMVRKDIMECFGDKALSVEHVGSTSIPGMVAKPVIDVAVLVEKIEEFSDEKKLMAERGYKYENEYIAPNTSLFYQENNDNKRLINIHVCAEGSGEFEKFIEGRDYLRSHPERVKLYNDLKQKLNKEFPDDYPSYRAQKQDFLKETKALAHQWKLSQ